MVGPIFIYCGYVLLDAMVHIQSSVLELRKIILGDGGVTAT